jgi:hypothetical protein
LGRQHFAVTFMATNNPLGNLRKGELKRILRHRRTPEVEVANMAADVLAERFRWTAAALGERMNLTFNEKIALGIRTMAPIDRPRWMVKAYYLQRRRERDRRRSKLNRAKAAVSAGLSQRAQALLAMLNHNWVPSTALDELAMKSFRRPSVVLGGRVQKLKHAAVRSAVLRAARELCEEGFADHKFAPGPKGGKVLYLRLADAKMPPRQMPPRQIRVRPPKKSNKTRHKLSAAPHGDPSPLINLSIRQPPN